MPVRIRLQRHGKKSKPFYWIVVADSRAKRDGRYLEKIGIYNPNTNPATVELDVNEAVKWLENGAQPSDTARTLLSYRGAMMKHHLNGGVKKGAFSQEDADKRFSSWLEEKQNKIQAKIDGLYKAEASDLAKKLKVEKAVNQKRIADMTAALEEEEAADETSTKDAPVDEATEKSATHEVDAIQEKVTAEVATDTSDSVEDLQVENTPAAEETKSEEAQIEVIKADEAPAKEDESKE